MGKIRKILTPIITVLAKWAIEQLIKRYDTNGDGALDNTEAMRVFDDFRKILARFNNRIKANGRK